MEKNALLEQYRTKKAEHPAHILIFRLGGVYVTLEQDAYVASRVLHLQVISRNLGAGRVPACDIPETSIMKHANILTKAGYAVAIYNQTDAEPVDFQDRAVTEVLPPEAGAPEISPVSEEDYAVFLFVFERALNREKAKSKPNVSHQIISELDALVLDHIDPAEAWAILYRWKRTFCHA